MKAYPIRGETVLAVPGRHEASALVDHCPTCNWSPNKPVAVIDDGRGGRVAAYRCGDCGHDWLCWWAKGYPS